MTLEAEKKGRWVCRFCCTKTREAPLMVSLFPVEWEQITATAREDQVRTTG